MSGCWREWFVVVKRGSYREVTTLIHRAGLQIFVLPPGAKRTEKGMRRFLGVLLLSLALPIFASARPFIVLVYNVENLFDADSQAMFEDYQPARYSRQHVLTKVKNVAEIVSRFENGRGPDIILFQEIEQDISNSKEVPNYEAILNRYSRVTIDEMLTTKFDDDVADLPAEALLAKAMADRGLTGYQVVRGENVRSEKTKRGMAQKCVVFTRFPVKQAISHPTLNARAIQEVQVEVDGKLLYLFNNHWKSGASSEETEPVRVENARTLRTRLDEILKIDPHADIILGGDFNSQYNQKVRYPKMKPTGINDTLGSQGNELAIRGKNRDLYNLWFELPSEERGSDTYQGEWGTLMQMIVSRGLYDLNGVQYVDNSFAVAKIPGLNTDDKGMPIPTEPFRKGIGFMVHPTYLVVPGSLQVAGRFAHTLPTGNQTSLDERSEAGAAATWFIASHALKLQFDYLRLWDEEGPSEGVNLFRTQLQAAF